jgi:hypothetical protein
MNVSFSQPTEVSSTNFDADRTGRAFSSLRVFDDRFNCVTIFFTSENAAEILAAIAEESQKILDFLCETEVSLDQPTEGNTE